MSIYEKIIFLFGLFINILVAISPAIILYLSASIIGKLSNNEFSSIYLIVFLFVIFTILSNLFSTISSFVSDSVNDIIQRIVKRNILYNASTPYELSIYEDTDKRKLLTLSLLLGDNLNSSIISFTAIIFGVFTLIPLSILIGSSIWWAPIVIIISLIPFIYYLSISEERSWKIKEKNESEFNKMRIYERILTQPEYAKEIRIFNMQEKLIKKWNDSFSKYFLEAQKIRKENSIYVTMSSLFATIILLVPLMYMIKIYIQGLINIETVALLISGIYGIKDGVSAILYNYSDCTKYIIPN